MYTTELYTTVTIMILMIITMIIIMIIIIIIIIQEMCIWIYTLILAGEYPALLFSLRPVHISRVFLLGVLESNFPGDSLLNSTDMRIPTPEN